MECSGLRYLAGTVVACLGAVVYSLGIPIGLWWLLRRNVMDLDDRGFCSKVGGRCPCSEGCCHERVSHIHARWLPCDAVLVCV